MQFLSDESGLRVVNSTALLANNLYNRSFVSQINRMSPTGRGSNPAPPIAAAFLDTRYIRALVFLKHLELATRITLKALPKQDVT